MSNSLEHAVASKEFDHSVPSMLNAEADSFAPSFSPSKYSPVHRSALRASAPVFFVPTARLLTPHSEFENEVTIASTFDSPSHGAASDIYQNETRYFKTPVDFSMDNGVGFDPVGLDASSFDTPSFDSSSFDSSSFDTASFDTASFDTTSFDTTSFDTTSFDTASFDTASFDATSFDTSSLDTSSQSVFGQYAQDHGIFDIPTYFCNTDNQVGNPNGPIYDLVTANKKNTDHGSLDILQQNQNISEHTPLHQNSIDQSSMESFKNSFESSTPIEDDDNLDGEGETDDEYQPSGSSPSGDAYGATPIHDDELDGEGETDDYSPPAASAQDTYDATPHYPTPSSDGSSSEQDGAGISQRLCNSKNADTRKKSTPAVKTGRVQKGKSGARTTPNNRLKKSILDQITCEDASGVTNKDTSGVTDEDTSGVTDEDTSGVTDEDTSGVTGEETSEVKDEGEILETVFTKFAAKKKKANVEIKQQGARTSLAERLGQNIRVVRTGGRVNIEGVYWYPPQDDLSIPSSHQAKLQCVENLVAAMCNNQDVKDKASTGFLNRWGDGASHYTQEELYACAWEMVDFMVDVHTKGWTQNTYDHKLREQWQQTMFSTFEERFETLVILLKRSKRTCDDIMKRERFYTAIGNPWEIEGRSSSNSKSNEDKGKKLKILTNGEHPEIVEQVKLVSSANVAGKRKRDGESEEVAGVSTARPRKQTRTRK